METKICNKCEVEKPLDGFSKHKGGKFGRRSDCKECRIEYNKQYYEANREARAEYNKQYYEASREARAEYNKQYYEANREARAAYQKQYYEANREALVENMKQYYEANREARAEYNKQYCKDNPHVFRTREYKRRQRLANAEHDPQVTRESLRDRYGTQCAYCGCVMNFNTSDYHIEYDPTHVNVDHIHPLSNGGAFTFDNTLLVCRLCNISKKNKSATEFLELTEEEVLFCQDLVILFPNFLD